MAKKRKDEYNLSDIVFAGIALLKENVDILHKFARHGLLLAKTGIDFLLLQLEEPKKKTKIKKIKIE